MPATIKTTPPKRNGGFLWVATGFSILSWFVPAPATFYLLFAAGFFMVCHGASGLIRALEEHQERNGKNGGGTDWWGFS